MYTITQRKTLHKQLAIVPANSAEQVIFNVDIVPEKMAGKFGELCWKVQQETSKKEPDAEAIGEAIVELFTIVFGKEQTEIMINMYEGNYLDLLVDVTPFLIEEIKPAIIEASNSKRDELKKLAEETKPKKKFWK